MPDINQVVVPQYEGNQPYHYTYDNLPIAALVRREDIINYQVDVNSAELQASFGTAGSLALRLAQSLQDNGNLKASGVDAALHNIGAHQDSTYEVTEEFLAALQGLGFPDLVNPVPFVRMLQAERDKLTLIANEAKNFSVGFTTPSGIDYIDNGILTFEDSTTITWTVANNQTVKAEVTSSLSNPHEHYDGITPTSRDLTPNYLDYLTNISSPFKEGSLKVFINGTRIFTDSEVYYPSLSDNPTWKLNKFTEYPNGLGFALLNAIAADDIIKIDFEVTLV
jgi:hypothetical protein